MKSLHLFIISLVLLIGCQASVYAQETADTQAEKQKVEEKIVAFFDALNAYDYQRMRDMTAENFTLIEDGAIWNLDSLITLAKKYEEKLTVNHTLSDINTELKGSTVWMTYKNKGVFDKGDAKNTIHFVESAVFVKQESGWKMKLLHSTKLDPKSNQKK